MNGPDSYPDVARAMAERAELMRMACHAAINRATAGQHVDPEHLRSCREFVAQNPPLAGPLGTGETQARTPLLLQDECLSQPSLNGGMSSLSQWLASRVDARQVVRMAFNGERG